jgi:hypothetical protein
MPKRPPFLPPQEGRRERRIPLPIIKQALRGNEFVFSHFNAGDGIERNPR